MAAGHALHLGPTADIPYLKSQQRLTFERVGIIDPLSVPDYVAHGGYEGLRNALALSPAQIVQAVTDSGLRGRGGAAFPTGIKWKTVLDQPAQQKYITCNADEGDSGTFADRMLMEGDPLTLIEGMTIAGLAVGATQGYIYLRAEYPHAHRALNDAIAAAQQAGYLGADILGSGRRFDLEVRLGAGAYICGEETSMLESLEGKRGEVRVRPPLPAIKGLFGQPTVVNNVITFASVPVILAARRAVLSGLRHRQIARHVADPAGGQHQARRTHRACVRADAAGAALRLRRRLGHGPADPHGAGRRAAGRVHPRVAVRRGRSTTKRCPASARCSGMAASWRSTTPSTWPGWHVMPWSSAPSSPAANARPAASARAAAWRSWTASWPASTPERNLKLLEDLCETMLQGSLCGLGGMTPFPVQSALKHFPQDFRARARHA